MACFSGCDANFKWLFICAAIVALCILPAGAAAEYQLVGFVDQQNIYMDTDRLQYFVNPQTNELYYDVWTKNVYSESGKAEMLQKIKVMGQYRTEWDNLEYCLIHKYYRTDKGQFKDIGFVFMTNDGKILEIGEVSQERVDWTPIKPQSAEDGIYYRVKLYEDANNDVMIKRSVRSRYKVINSTGRITESIDTANAKFFKDTYSGNVIAEVWLRVDMSGEAVKGEWDSRKQKGLPIKGWELLGYVVEKYYLDFERSKSLLYSVTYCTKQGAVLQTFEMPLEKRIDWQQPIPGSLWEKTFFETKKYMVNR
ncbi:MAG: hypothetical protein P4N59_21490 [Negativicutes bacterium]|nr:hypothetical protein [Negativicutes bacterium]